MNITKEKMMELLQTAIPDRASIEITGVYHGPGNDMSLRDKTGFARIRQVDVEEDLNIKFRYILLEA